MRLAILLKSQLKIIKLKILQMLYKTVKINKNLNKIRLNHHKASQLNQLNQLNELSQKLLLMSSKRQS